MPARKSLIVKLPIPSRNTRSPTNTTSITPFQNSHPAIRSDSTIAGKFGQSQLALAHKIVKSIPKGMPAPEYIDQVRKHIKVGEPVARNQVRYLDTAEFWKEQFEKLQAEKQKLQDENNCLKEAQRLGRKRTNAEFEDVDSLPDAEGGISDFEDIIAKNTGDLEAAALNDDRLRLSNYAFRLRKSRASLEKISLQSGNLNAITLCTERLLALLHLLDTALEHCCLPLSLARDDDEHSRISTLFQQLMSQVVLGFLACLSMIDDLYGTIPGRAKKGEIVYKTVMIYTQGLDVLQTGAKNQTLSQVSNDDRRQKRQRTESSEYFLNKHLAKALCTIVYRAEWKPAHSEILEGLLSSILNHTGRIVSEAVFGEHVAESSEPGNITESRSQGHTSMDNPENRYIVPILYAAVGAEGRMELVAQLLAGRSSIDNSNILHHRGSAQVLMSVAKKLLQSTLVKSIVGGTELEDLHMPAAPTEFSLVTGSRAVSTEMYKNDWLIEMVYGIVGWDTILSP